MKRFWKTLSIIALGVVLTLLIAPLLNPVAPLLALYLNVNLQTRIAILQM